MQRLMLWLAAMAVVVAACGAVPSPTVTPSPTAPRLPAPTASPTTTPTPAPTRVPPLVVTAVTTPVFPAGSVSAVSAAVQDLSQKLNVPVSSISVTSVQAYEWPDSSLGCPQPGQMYLQVITPGYKIVLTANGKDYEYHSDTRGRVVSCQAR